MDFSADELSDSIPHDSIRVQGLFNQLIMKDADSDFEKRCIAIKAIFASQINGLIYLGQIPAKIIQGTDLSSSLKNASNSFYFAAGMTVNLVLNLLGSNFCRFSNLTTEMKQRVCLSSIHRIPHDAMAYYNLALTLTPGESITLLNGEPTSEKQLLLQVIHLNPIYADAYYNLAAILEPDESITLLNGEVKSQQQLFLEASRLRQKILTPT